jgi:hypothetical protein
MVTGIEVVELALPDGGSVLVRTEKVGSDSQDGEPEDVGFTDALSFSTVGATIRGVATDIHHALKSVEPDVTEVEFGLELAMKGSKLVCLLVDGETKATLKVRMEWRKDDG